MLAQNLEHDNNTWEGRPSLLEKYVETLKHLVLKGLRVEKVSRDKNIYSLESGVIGLEEIDTKTNTSKIKLAYLEISADFTILDKVTIGVSVRDGEKDSYTKSDNWTHEKDNSIEAFRDFIINFIYKGLLIPTTENRAIKLHSWGNDTILIQPQISLLNALMLSKLSSAQVRKDNTVHIDLV